jgi:hypothetical protein
MSIENKLRKGFVQTHIIALEYQSKPYLEENLVTHFTRRLFSTEITTAIAFQEIFESNVENKKKSI